MSIQQINNGDLGSKARATINSSARAVQLAAGGRQAIIDTFGDSISGNGATGLGGVFRAAAFYWAPGLNIQIRTGYGRGGSLSAELIANQGPNTAQLTLFQNAIAGGASLPDICAIQTHSNDNFTAANALSFAENQITFANAVLAMGVPLVIICSSVPKATSGADQSGRMTINSLLRRYADLTPGVVFFDWFSEAFDPNAAFSSSITPWNSVFGGYSTDGVHPTGGAAFFAGKAMADLLLNIVGRVQPRTMANIRYADTNANTRWNNLLGPEGNFQGTGGQLNGVDDANVAGTANTQNNRWQITTPAGVTVTPSIITDANGVRQQRMVLSGTPSANGQIILRYNNNYQPVTSALFERQAILDVTNLAGISEFSAMGVIGPSWSPPSATGVFPTHSGKWFMRTINGPQTFSSGGAQNYDVSLNVLNGVPVSGTVDVSRCCVYQVPATVP
jgi:hypothetical protein